MPELVKWARAEGAENTLRPLTRSLDRSKEGLTVDATHKPEEWRPVLGWEGFYEVSDHGQVRSLHPGKFRYKAIMHAQIKEGYRIVHLCAEGRRANRPVHQLVLEAFTGARPEGLVTRHLNSVRNDNRLGNLAWGTPLDNAEDRRRTGLKQIPRARQWNR